MRSLNILNGVLVSVVLAFATQGASAQDAVRQTAAHPSSDTVAAIQAKLSPSILSSEASPVHEQAEADGFRFSDMLLAMIAGVVLVVLQLRRQQKAQSETRIINFNERLHNLERFNVRVARRVTSEATMSQAAEADLIAHAERG